MLLIGKTEFVAAGNRRLLKLRPTRIREVFMDNRHYWGYRIDTLRIEFFNQELQEGRLRQGWGYDERQNLINFTAFDDSGAKRNFPIYHKVKKGDILLIPRLPDWGEITIAEATEDFDKGYKFIISEHGDYGHIFPAKIVKHFSRTNEHVDSGIRTSFRNPLRFWNIDYLEESIDKLINSSENLCSTTSIENKIDGIVLDIINEKNIEEELFEIFNKKFEGKEWENVLVEGLKEIFPYYSVELRGGKSEAMHGTDILVRIPSLTPESSYAIAIQVKDYSDTVGTYPLEQLSKADFWSDDYSMKLIDKILIITKAPKDKNIELSKKADEMGITVFMEDEVKQLIFKIALKKALKGIK